VLRREALEIFYDAQKGRLRMRQAFLFARGRPSSKDERHEQRRVVLSKAPTVYVPRRRALDVHHLLPHGSHFAFPSSMSNSDKYYLYILKCFDNTLYVGYTSNIKNRLFWHQSGFASQYTSVRLPVKLVYTEEHTNETSALERENQIKRWSGVKKDALIRGDLMQLRKLSKSREV